MLVTQWLDHDNRETRDADFLGFGESDAETIKAIFTEIMAITSDDGLDFDTKALTATAIRDEMEYGGIRLKTSAYLERTRIRAYPPAQVIAEKFQAVVALGLANGRMKDFYDLWAIPKAMPVDGRALDTAIAAPFERSATAIPAERPAGLSAAMSEDAQAQRRWRAYIQSLELAVPDYADVLDDIRACSRRVAHDYLT
jgi:Nucleotidyl transferase AbiEii toxin, Type IV TA system